MKHILTFALSISTLFVFPNNVAGAQLQFEAGQTASYIVTQKKVNETVYVGDDDIFDSYEFGDKEISEIEETISFDVKILSVNPETLSYPIEVELTLNSLSSKIFTQLGDNEANSLTINVPGISTLENYTVGRIINKLINTPLQFTVQGDFSITENTGILEKVQEQLMIATLGYFDFPILKFDLLLTQLFHLSGQDLQEGQSYPVSSNEVFLGATANQFFSFNNNKGTSAYQLSNSGVGELSADWKANIVTRFTLKSYPAYVKYDSDSEWRLLTWSSDSFDSSSDTDDFDMVAFININGNVTWDANNPLKQSRQFSASFKGTQNQFSSVVNFTLEQNWEVVSE